ncbi:MAG: phosphate acyltransferase PlsX [Clostridia bacterium]|nr:phosphate acyltransferase PlsX [Clostridia bacterium]
MRIVIDAFGGDNAPLEIIKGASIASLEYGVEITLCGKQSVIESVIAENKLNFFGELKIVDCEDVLTMHDDPTSILKSHANSSMGVAFSELKEDKADAFVSAGSTGAIVVGGTLIVKRIKGIKRPALASALPSPKGSYLLMDMGANADSRPEMLEQFGVMSSVYLNKVMGIENPKIALLNIGSEDTKGDELHIEAYKLLKANGKINFVGNIEAREVPKGEFCDGVVTDGFSGNIVLKTIEGASITLFSLIKKILYKSTMNKLSALVLKKDLYSLKTLMDSSEVGGAILLGVSKPVIKAHGNSNAKAIKNAVRQAKTVVENNIIGTIAENI